MNSARFFFSLTVLLVAACQRQAATSVPVAKEVAHQDSCQNVKVYNDTCLRAKLRPNRFRLPVSSDKMVKFIVVNHTSFLYSFGGLSEDKDHPVGHSCLDGSFFVERFSNGEWTSLETVEEFPGVFNYYVHNGIQPGDTAVLYIKPFAPRFFKYPPGRYRVRQPFDREQWNDVLSGMTETEELVTAEFEILDGYPDNR